MVLPRTGYVKVVPLPSKESESTATAWRLMKHNVEAATDPGGKQDYRIQRVQIDPGSEFHGKFLSSLALSNSLFESCFDEGFQYGRGRDPGCIPQRVIHVLPQGQNYSQY